MSLTYSFFRKFHFLRHPKIHQSVILLRGWEKIFCFSAKKIALSNELTHKALAQFPSLPEPKNLWYVGFSYIENFSMILKTDHESSQNVGDTVWMWGKTADRSKKILKKLYTADNVSLWFSWHVFISLEKYCHNLIEITFHFHK